MCSYNPLTLLIRDHLLCDSLMYLTQSEHYRCSAQYVQCSIRIPTHFNCGYFFALSALFLVNHVNPMPNGIDCVDRLFALSRMAIVRIVQPILAQSHLGLGKLAIPNRWRSGEDVNATQPQPRAANVCAKCEWNALCTRRNGAQSR